MRVKIVTYHCRACKRDVTRLRERAAERLKSHCATTGKDVTMRRVRWRWA